MDKRADVVENYGCISVIHNLGINLNSMTVRGNKSILGNSFEVHGNFPCKLQSYDFITSTHTAKVSF